jgi:preprotein translocase subunit SecD
MVYVTDMVVLSTTDMSSVDLVLEGDEHGIELRVQPAAAKSLWALTGEIIGHQLAIFVDGRLHSAPTVQDRFGESMWLHGGFTDEELRDLAQRLASELRRVPGGVDP